MGASISIESAIGKDVKLWVKPNNFQFSGKLMSIDQEYICILDYKSGHKNFFSRQDVLQVELLQKDSGVDI